MTDSLCEEFNIKLYRETATLQEKGKFSILHQEVTNPHQAYLIFASKIWPQKEYYSNI